MNLSLVITQLKKFRTDHKGQKFAFLFTKDELQSILNHYDGVRVYLGEDNGELTAYGVSVDKDANGRYNDIDLNLSGDLTLNATVVKGRPCPTLCGSMSLFNS